MGIKRPDAGFDVVDITFNDPEIYHVCREADEEFLLDCVHKDFVCPHCGIHYGPLQLMDLRLRALKEQAAIAIEEAQRLESFLYPDDQSIH